MAVRELFAKFGFEFDQAALQKMESLVDAAEKQVEALADAANRATAPLGKVSAAQRGVSRSAEKAASSAKELRAAMVAAASEDKVAAAFRALGMSVDKASASGRSASSVWREMVGRLARVKDEAERARLAVALLGREQAQEALAQSAGGIDAMRTRRRGAGRPTGYRVAPAVVAEPPARTVSRWERYRGAVRAGTDAVRQHRKASDELRRNASSGITGGLLQAAFWFGLARGIINAWQAIGRFAFGATVTLGRLVGDTTVWADSTQKALGMISGFGVQTGIKEFEEITATAARLGLNVIEAADNYKRLRAVGFGRDEGNELVKMAADMKAGLGLEDEVVKRVFLAVGQIKGAGRLMGEELLQLQDTGINTEKMWASIAETMGVTVEKAKELKEQGKVSADVAIKGVKDAVMQTLGTNRLGEAAETLASSTLRGLLAGAKSGAQLWLLELSGELKPKLEELAGKIAGTFDKFKKDGKVYKAIDGVKRLVLDFIDLVIIRWPEIERVIGKVLDAAGSDLGKIILGLDDFMTKVLGVVEFVADHWERLKTAFVIASAVMVVAMGLIGTAAVIQAGKVAFAFGVSAVKGLAAFRAGLTASVTASKAAGAAMNLSLAGVAATIGALAAMLASLVAVYDQVTQLMAETKADGGVAEGFGKAGGARGFAKFIFGQDNQSYKDFGARINGKPVAPDQPKTRMRPNLPATGMPFGGPSLPFGPTAFNNSTTINISGMASPAGVAREVDTAIGRRDRAQREALYGALSGARQYG